MRALLVLMALASTGCLRQTEFQCSTDTACGANGHCAAGYCSFADTGCSSGFRYGDSAGTRAGQCTDGGNPVDDGGVDARLIDARMIDGALGCPGQYAALPNVATHVYFFVAATGNWNQQQAGCRATSASAYLAIPDTSAELQALGIAANGNDYWVGITDLANEDVWVNVKMVAQTFLPWESGAAPNPAGNDQDDCVYATGSANQFRDDKCSSTFVAVCECEP